MPSAARPSVCSHRTALARPCIKHAEEPSLLAFECKIIANKLGVSTLKLVHAFGLSAQKPDAIAHKPGAKALSGRKRTFAR